ncbi:MAG: DUF4175 family protein [Acidobacteriota bacterium]
MPGSALSIFNFLRRAAQARRRRLFLLRAVRGLTLLSIILGLGLLLLLAWPGLRTWILLALASVAIAAVVGLAAVLFVPTGPAATAAWLRRRRPALGGAVADAVEFSEGLAEGEGPRTGSAAFAQAHVENTATRLRGLAPGAPAAEAWPSLPVRGLAVALALTALIVVFLPRARSLLLFGPAPATLAAASHAGVEATYVYPAYLQLPPRTELGSGDLVAPAGTHVRLKLEADQNLDRAWLEVSGIGPQDMEVAERAATGSLVLVEDGTYRIHLQGEVGGLHPDPPVHVIKAQADEKPRVRLRAPSSDVILDEDDEIELLYEASDDHGVAEVAWLLHRDGGEADTPDFRKDTLQEVSPPRRRVLGSRRLPVRKLGLYPGESAWLSVTARDAEPTEDDRWSESRRVRVTLRSPDEVIEELDRSQEELAEVLLDLLGNHLVSHPERLPDRPALVRATEDFDERISFTLQLFPGVLEALSSGLEEDAAAVSALEDMREQLLDLRQRRRRLGIRQLAATGPNVEARDLLDTLHRDEVEEIERDVLFFDMWADRRAALRASDTAAELMDLVAAMQEALDAQASEDEVEALREALAAEMDRMAELAAELAETDPSSSQSAQHLEQAREEARDALQELQQALQEGRRDDAQAELDRMARMAAEMSDALDSLSQRARLGDPELAAEVERLQRELNQLRQRQADLRDRTNQLRDSASERLGEEDRQRLDELYQEMIALAEEAVALHAEGDEGVGESGLVLGFFSLLDEREELDRRWREVAGLRREQARIERRLAEVRRELLHFELDVERLMNFSQQVRQQLGRLQQSLADRDAGSSEQAARRSFDGLDVLGSGLRRGTLEDEAIPFRSAQARVAEILDLLEQLRQQSQQAASQAMTDGEREQMQQMAGEQGELSQRMSELAQRLAELGAGAAFLQEEMGQAVQEAADHARSASEELGQGRPGEASESQGEALSRLEEAAEQLSPGRRQRPSRRQGQEGRRGDPRNEDVEIPDAEDYRVPEAFREEILAAMRESSASTEYQAAVREYYRRLVE